MMAPIQFARTFRAGGVVATRKTYAMRFEWSADLAQWRVCWHDSLA